VASDKGKPDHNPGRSVLREGPARFDGQLHNDIAELNPDFAKMAFQTIRIKGQ